MGQKERNIIKNKEKKEQIWRERQEQIQKCRAKTDSTIYESEQIFKHAYENGFD